jgi:aromatic-L-amino-acid decarboxylase
VEKGMKIAGYGSNQLRKIRVDEKFAMIPEVFERQIIDDLNEGLIPLCVISAVGTTSSHGIDPVRKISEIAIKYEMYHHVDAAHAGNATVLEECRWMIDGLELADSYVFNPHKWMFTNFDCSLFYVKQKEVLVRTFEILPEYLKTGHDSEVNNYRDWGIQLGRRFRALKLWFVLRSYGLEGIRAKFREHIELAKYFEEQLNANGDFEIMAPRPLNLVCFRLHPTNSMGDQELDKLNKKVKESINTQGKAYLTHTTLHGKYTLRVSIGQTSVEKRHVDALLKMLIKIAGEN